MLICKSRSAILSFVAALAIGIAAGGAQAANASNPAGLKQAGTSPALLPAGRTELPSYTGDFDHFAVDLKGNRLFLAAEDHGTLEVFDLSSGRHLKTVEGFEAPHAILHLADKNRLIVTDSGAGLSKVLDGTTYKIIDTVKLRPGADSMGYDAAAKRLYVVTGGKNGKMKSSYLSKVDPGTGKHFGDIEFDTDKVETMAIEKNGNHLYVNVTGKNYVAVIDKKKFAVIGTWPIKEAEMNAALAFDEANRRLFVVTRKPFKLVILDSGTGASIASFAAPERTNEIMFDKINRRIYLAGDNFISVFRQKDADHYEELPQVPTAVGAKTAILVPERNRIFIALSPGEGKTGAAVLRFDIAPNATEATAAR
jgi:hypothetical protein